MSRKMDEEAIEAANGENPPLMLVIMDLSMWKRIFEYASTDLPKAMSQLKHFSLIIHALPYLKNLNINDVVKVSREDMEETYSSSQSAAELDA
jgi:uncharacterized membrane protein YgcG